jgi:transcriptional regulator GlxA family with amidase domain
MVSVVIAALSGTASIGTVGLMDALNKADLAAGRQAGQSVPRVFEVRLAGLDGGTVSCRDGVSLQPSVVAGDVAAPDLVVVPGLDDDLAASFAANRGWAPWLAKWHAAGARVASSCTGAFLVADAGLLDGRPATTHWLFADELRRRYPAVRVTADQMIVDNGDVITSGGAVRKAAAGDRGRPDRGGPPPGGLQRPGRVPSRVQAGHRAVAQRLPGRLRPAGRLTTAAERR